MEKRKQKRSPAAAPVPPAAVRYHPFQPPTKLERLGWTLNTYARYMCIGAAIYGTIASVTWLGSYVCSRLSR